MCHRVFMLFILIFVICNVSAAVPTDYLFYFDAKEVNGAGQSQPADGDLITQWVDLSTGIVASASNSENPRFDLSAINGYPGVKFGPVGGTNEGVFKIPSSTAINLDSSGYSQKTFAIVFKTASDINTLQFVYEQGGRVNGYNVMIKDGELWFGVWRSSSTPQNNSINLGAIAGDTVYQVVAVHDSSSSEIRVYIDGVLAGTGTIPDPLIRHSGSVHLGGNDPTIDVSQTGITGTIDNGIDFFFKGHIGEFYSWNDALSTTEIADVTEHFNEQWAEVDITISQTVGVIDDFISSANPKAISGAILQYSILVTNEGLGLAMDDTTSLSFNIDESKYRFYIGSDTSVSPITIQDISGSTGISFQYLTLDSTSDGFSVYDSSDQLIVSPTVDGEALTGVSKVQLNFEGVMSASANGIDPQFEITYKIILLSN